MHPLLVTSFLCLISFSAIADFLPPNDLHIPVDAKTGITEEDFNLVIDMAEKAYAPIISQRGATLKIERLWKKGSVNAEAEQIGSDWVVRMFGGMARYRTMNKEGFTIVFCHELGHHLGGFPIFSNRENIFSNEGQSDYFSTLKCVRRLWSEVDNGSLLTLMAIPPALMEVCQKNWSTQQQTDICLRSGIGALAIGEMLALNRRHRLPLPKIEKTDQSEVNTTNQGHNKPQCRLDTFIQGAVCSKNFVDDVSFETEVTGTCHALNGDTVGLRPRCWFMPQTDG